VSLLLCVYQTALVDSAIKNNNNNTNNNNNNNKANKAAVKKIAKYGELENTHIFFPVAIETAGAENHLAIELV